MSNSILDAVEKVLDDADEYRDEDWYILGERLREAILESPLFPGTNFTEPQQKALIAICRETYYAASLLAKGYIYKAVEAIEAWRDEETE